MRNPLVIVVMLICCCFATASERPNVIIMLADDMGWGDLGCYPKGKEWGDEAYCPTPNLDALAASGVQCMQGYATGMVCSPSRAGLLSGQHQQRWGFYGFEDTTAPIPSSIKLLPQAMREAGYRTGMFGKWHVSTDPSSWPLKVGFDRFFGFLAGQHDYFDASLGQTFHGVGWARDAYTYDQDQPVKKVKYYTEEFTDRAITFMDESLKAKQPFFVYLPYNAPHPPHQAPWADLGPLVEKRGGKFVPRDGARAEIINLDTNVGRITKWLADNGIDKNTLIFFSSDNGGSDGGPGKMLQHNGGLRGRKGTYYEGGIREPYLVSWPGTLPAGEKYDKPVSHLDMYATALAVSQAKDVKTQKLDGVDLIPYLTGKNTGSPHEVLYWRLEQPSRWAVRDGDWKLVLEDLEPETMGKGRGTRTREMKLQLFNISSDPTEKDDLSEKQPDIVKKLSAMHDAFVKECPPSLYTPEVEKKHKAALAARKSDGPEDDEKTAYGSPGHWFGGGAKERTERDAQEAAGQ